MYQPDHLYHIYNQGNNRQKIFTSNKDYEIFLTLYKRLFVPCCSTIAWCLMPNHFHFMVHADDRSVTLLKQGGITIDALTNAIRKLLSGYARIFNNLNNRTGSLFRQKTKSKCLTDIIDPFEPELQIEEYYINCFNYIHQNPVAANLVKKPEDWEFSSYRNYAGLHDETFCNRDLAVNFCGYDETKFSESSIIIPDKRIIDLFS